jgi:hypothetical protein
MAGEMRLNYLGVVVELTWKWLSQQYLYTDPGSFIVMPNHFDGILQILEFEDYSRGGSRPAPTNIKALDQLIGAFKTVSAKK